MPELKCPFCQQKLHQDPDGFYTCYTDNCSCMAYGGNGASGSESLWKSLIATRNALEIAIDALDYVNGNDTVIHEAIKQINEITKGETNAN